MARWHHWLDGHESEWTLGVGDGQGGLACCDSWGRKESDTTEPLIWSDLICGPIVIRLTSFLWVWVQCVCPLMPSCNTYRLSWVSLTLGVGNPSRLLQQSTAISPYLRRGVSPHCHPSWPSMWDSSFRPSCTLCPRSGAEARRRYPTPQARGQGLWPGAPTPSPRSRGCTGAEENDYIFPLFMKEWSFERF